MSFGGNEKHKNMGFALRHGNVRQFLVLRVGEISEDDIELRSLALGLGDSLEKSDEIRAFRLTILLRQCASGFQTRQGPLRWGRRTRISVPMFPFVTSWCG